MLSIDRLNRIAKLFNAKGIVMRTITRPKRNNGNFEPNKFGKKFNVNQFDTDGFKSVTVDTESGAKRHILFFHGGAYVSEGLIFHRKFVEKTARDYNYRVTYVDYPLAPEHTATETHAVVYKAYKYITDNYPEDKFVIMGDSAGGGLALAFRQRLAEENFPVLPAATVLISPWLDVSMSNPDAFIYEEKDPTLSVMGLLYAGKRYAGALDVKDPKVSPIYGGLDNLGRMLVFVGTHELFYPDCRDFERRCLTAQGTETELVVFEGMFHDFVMTPIKASKDALDKIHEFLEREV